MDSNNKFPQNLKDRNNFKSNSKGTRVFHQQGQQSSRKKTKLEKDNDPISADNAESFIDGRIKTEIDNNSYCCALGGEHSCIFTTIFPSGNNECIDHSDIIKYIKTMRSTQLNMFVNFENDKRDMWLINTVKSCIYKDNISKSGERYFEYDCRVPDPQNFTDNGNIINFGQTNYKKVCCKTFQLIYGISKYEWELVVKRFKETNSTDIYQLRVKRFSDDHLHEYSYREGEQILEQNVLNPQGKFSTLADKQMLRVGLTPYAETQHFCKIWLEDFFERQGDMDPDSENVNIQLTLRKELYKKYASEMKSRKREHVSEKRFNEIWNVIFPHHQIRPYCDKPGHCDLCYEVDRGRRLATTKAQEKRFTEAHFIHRCGLFMLERDEYLRRINHVYEDIETHPNVEDQTVASFVIDVMDQNHSKIPWKGTQGTFTHPLNQMITGVKEHGYGVTIYPSCDSVNKGANLTMQILLMQLEDWRNRHNGNYPTILYLQVDGGSENANQYVLHMIELLVHKRMAKTIFYTRLPTGHTHCDIDGCFGVIWKCWYRFKTVDTFSQFQNGVQQAFLDDMGLKCEVKDVITVCPDWISFLTQEGVMDRNLSGLHTNLQTMHQWRFDAVPLSRWFPFEVKACYRQYSSKIVAEAVKKPKAQCITEIGKETGLEFYKVYIRWNPAADPKRSDRPNIEGIYLLKKIPHLDSNTLPPVPFPQNIHTVFQDCVNAAKREYKNDKDSYNEWLQFEKYIAPQSDNAADYLNQLRHNGKSFHIPLKHILLNKNIRIFPRWIIDADSTTNIEPPILEPGFRFPDEIAAALDSVESEFNRNPQPPRLYTSSDATVRYERDLFNDTVKAYYSDKLKSLLNNDLIFLLRRKVSYSGENASIDGTKKQLIERIKSKDQDFICHFNRPLSHADFHFVDSIRSKVFSTVAEQNKVVSKINDSINITQKMLKQFNENSAFLTDTMNAIMSIFDKRDKRILMCHHDVNNKGRNYDLNRFKPSLFLTYECFNLLKTKSNVDKYLEQLSNNYKNSNFEENLDICNLKWNIRNIYRIFFCVSSTDLHNLSNSWSIIFIEFSFNNNVCNYKINLIDPLINEQNKDDFMNNDNFLSYLKNTEEVIDYFLEQYIIPKFNLLSIEVVDNNRTQIKSNRIYIFTEFFFTLPEQGQEYNSGVYFSAILYYLVTETPMCFSIEALLRLRHKIAYWLLSEELPF